jgi:hypothetical protein
MFFYKDTVLADILPDLIIYYPILIKNEYLIYPI